MADYSYYYQNLEQSKDGYKGSQAEWKSMTSQGMVWDKELNSWTLPEVVITGNKKDDVKPQPDSDIKDKQITNPNVPKDANTNDSVQFVEPINPTDPFVWHDPSTSAGVIVKNRQSDNHKPENDESILETELQAGTQRDQSTEKVEGIFTPVIRLNNVMIEKSNIIYFKFTYIGFAPELFLHIKDLDAQILQNDIPGMNNIVTFALVPSVEGKYKTIKMAFTIETCEFISQTEIKYTCKWKFAPFQKNMLKSVIYPGCTNVIKNATTAQGETTSINEACNKSHNMFPNTWELLHTIALETGLGFQSTQQCREIADNRARLISSERYIDWIPKQVAFGGLDTESIFDCWIDLYGYITLVNLPYIFKSEYNYQHYAMYAIVGQESTNANISGPQYKKVNRLITCNKLNGNHSNLTFQETAYRSYSNNETIFDEGTLTSQWLMQPEGVRDGANNISTEQIATQEDSVDGMHFEDYEFARTEFMGVEMGEQLPCLMQQRLHDKYMRKLSNQVLEVVLDKPNYALQRGTIIDVHIFTHSTQQKQKILSNDKNLYEEDKEANTLNQPTNIDDGDNTSDGVNRKIYGDEIGVPNQALSGQYYISGMEFTYEDEGEEADRIVQKLFLLKKGAHVKYNNRNNVPRALRPE